MRGFTDFDERYLRAIERGARICREAKVAVKEAAQGQHACEMHEAFANNLWCYGCRNRVRYLLGKLEKVRRV